MQKYLCFYFHKVILLKCGNVNDYLRLLNASSEQFDTERFSCVFSVSLSRMPNNCCTSNIIF